MPPKTCETGLRQCHQASKESAERVAEVTVVTVETEFGTERGPRAMEPEAKKPREAMAVETAKLLLRGNVRRFAGAKRLPNFRTFALIWAGLKYDGWWTSEMAAILAKACEVVAE